MPDKTTKQSTCQLNPCNSNKIYKFDPLSKCKKPHEKMQLFI